jgi:hypothetical protein
MSVLRFVSSVERWFSTGVARAAQFSERRQRTFRVRMLATMLPVSLVLAVAPIAITPTLSEASGSRVDTNCVSWYIFYGGSPEWSACLTSSDWFNGSQVGTNWESPSCNVLWIERFAWSCSNFSYNHYWNSGIGANTDWYHQRMNLTGELLFSYCANVNINTWPSGYRSYGNSIYRVWFWQSC